MLLERRNIAIPRLLRKYARPWYSPPVAEPDGIVGEIRPDPLTRFHDEDGRRTNPAIDPDHMTREARVLATRRTLYLLIASIVALLLNAFGVFLFVTLTVVITPQQVWYLWADGVVAGVVLVYMLGLIRKLHHVLRK